MDKLSFSFDTPEIIDSFNNLKTYLINIHLNDEVISTSLNISDILALKNKEIKNTEFFLFTCSCRIPECAGYYKETTHFINESNVIWNIPNENGINLSKYTFTFDIDEFYSVIDNLFLDILKLEKENSFHVTLVEDVFDSENETFIGVKLDSFLDYQIKHHINNNQFLNFLNNYAPELNKNSYSWIYNDISEKISLKHFIFSLLNDHINSRTYMPYFFKKTALAIKAFELCLNNDFSLFEKIAYHHYKNFEGNSLLHAIRFLDIKDSDFNISNLRLIKV